MKVAIVYNRQSKRVINVFGMPNQEKIGIKTIERIAQGLRKGGHQVQAMEGDKDIIGKLEHFMPRVVKGEIPGMVFNVSYGIQGQARYTHVPSILEMIGIPYVASGPLAHSLALDKVVAKMIFKQNGISTPDFAVLNASGFDAPKLKYPLIVKPKSEAVSFGIKVVHNETELREGADAIFEKFDQPVLAEQFIEGREINVGLLGNNPPDTLPPVELGFGSDGGETVYSYEDKTGRSGRNITWTCPAKIDKSVEAEAIDLARRSFEALGCYDCARVDLRMDKAGKLYVLEVNSLPSMGEHGSFTIAAEKAGLTFDKLVCRLVEVASARYFGTPTPPSIAPARKDASNSVFQFLVQRRDEMEKKVHDWTAISSRTSDPAGIHEAKRQLELSLEDLGMSAVPDLTDDRAAWTWQTKAGLDKGTLLVVHLDVPLELDTPSQVYRRDPEWLFGEGVGVSRAPLVQAQFAFRALRSVRRLRKIPLGLLVYSDEGRDCRYSHDLIQKAAGRAKNMLVLRPGSPEQQFVFQRRGWRRYEFVVSGTSRRLGKEFKKRNVLRWAFAAAEKIVRLSSQADRVAVEVSNFRSVSFPKLLPHRVEMEILVNFLQVPRANKIERKLTELAESTEYACTLNRISDRPPMKKDRPSTRLQTAFKKVAEEWEIPLAAESSLYPSVAGIAPDGTGVMCGIGPVARDLDTSHEAVLRLSLMQRTLLLAQFLLSQNEESTP